MPQINCIDCGHPMSDKAKTCPNCNAPRKVLNFKACVNCGQEIESIRKKCPHCNTLQSAPPKQNNNQMKSKNSSSAIAMPLIMLVVGVALTYLAFDQGLINSDPAYSNDCAKVQRINNLYVFIESTPMNTNYSTIETLKGDDLFEMINSLGIGKEKFGKVIQNLIRVGSDNLSMNELVLKMTEMVNDQYPEASGIIFMKNLKKCQVIKFVE